jgi:hypothetical protein
MTTSQPPQISLPKSWPKDVRSALLHVIALAQYATTYTRSWAVDSMNGRVRVIDHAQGAFGQLFLGSDVAFFASTFRRRWAIVGAARS